MKTPWERMPRSNALSNPKSACSTSDQRLDDAVDTGRRLPSAGDLPVGLANRCPTCLVEMEWIHSHYQCPLPLARLMLHVKEENNTSCRPPREPIRISTIVARSNGTRLSLKDSLPRRLSGRRYSLSSAGLLEARAAPWSRAPFRTRPSRPDSTSPLWRWPLIAISRTTRYGSSGPCTCRGRARFPLSSTPTRKGSSSTGRPAAGPLPNCWTTSHRSPRGHKDAESTGSRETSPYLRQHAENPVDWYPSGEEAFRRAREEDKVEQRDGHSDRIGYR